METVIVTDLTPNKLVFKASASLNYSSNESDQQSFSLVTIRKILPSKWAQFGLKVLNYRVIK